MAVRKVGSSRILKEIGRGGMGVVYEAYQEGLDRRVAVKALDARQARSRELVERFRREGRAYAQIRHPGVVAVHDLVEKDETLYLVTEFVDGADLRRVLASGGPLPAGCVAALGARLADALDGVHRHALLHRDVKPANVMVSRTGEVKLMDFGILKDPMATELTRAGAVMGTPAYVAPEVLEGQPASERSDVWSLGVTLYEVACGERPFAGNDFHELFAAVRKARPRPLRDAVPGFPRRLARAIERCLEKRPGRRWDTAAALARELEACAARLGGDAPQDRLRSMMVERGLAEPRTRRTPGEDERVSPATENRAWPGPAADRAVWAFAAVLAVAVAAYALLAKPW
ncbi:MAG TPA: serine/threonine-protein kinase [Anaeromyxobacteraceae bacterium]|nr:serine/threonine-protein kinase [Anaeromyxobacteraceae bacterium]